MKTTMINLTQIYERLLESKRSGRVSEPFEDLVTSAYDRPTLCVRQGLVLSTETLAARADLALFVNGSSLEQTRYNLVPLHDTVLAAEGLRLYRVSVSPFHMDGEAGIEAHDWSFLVFMLYLRLWISLRIVEESQAYLAKRTSGGIATLQHQLVKDTFAEFFITFSTITSDLQHMLTDKGRVKTLVELHRQVSLANHYALRLMGGRGYLHDGSAQLGYISEMIRNLYGLGVGEGCHG